MDLNEIASGLAVKFKIDDLAVEDGETSLEIDGIPIQLSEDVAGEAIVMTGLVGEAPVEGGEAFANLLLEATMGLMDTKAAALARNHATGAYVLVQRVGEAGFDLDSFCSELGAFVDTVEAWRNVLDGFGPVAASARAEEAPPPAFDVLHV